MLKRMIDIIKSKKQKPKINLDKIILGNKHLDFVKRFMDKNTPSVMIQGQIDPSTHFMESGDGIVYPTVVHDEKDGLRFMGTYLGNDKQGNPMYNTDEARKYALRTKNYIKFDSDEDAQYFSENYKNSRLVKIGKSKKK